jgi:hypothetical protein
MLGDGSAVILPRCRVQRCRQPIFKVGATIHVPPRCTTITVQGAVAGPRCDRLNERVDTGV